MADVATGAVLLSITAILAIVLRQLDRIVTPVDGGGMKLGELESVEIQVVEWILVPLSKHMSLVDEVLPRRDIDKIRTAYHYNVAAIERARQLARDFDDNRTTLDRGLVTGALILVPAGVLAALPVSETWIPLAIQVLVVMFSGFAFVACHALLLMGKARKEYGSVTSALRERMSNQSLISLQTDRGGGLEHG